MRLQNNSCSEACARNGRCSARSRQNEDVSERHASAAICLMSSRLRQDASCFPAEIDLSIMGTFSDSDLTSSLSTSTRPAIPSLLYSHDVYHDDDEEILTLARELYQAVQSFHRNRSKRRPTSLDEPQEDSTQARCKTLKKGGRPISLSFGSRSLDEMLEMDRRTTRNACLDGELSVGDSTGTVDSLMYYKIREQKARNKQIWSMRWISNGGDQVMESLLPRQHKWPTLAVFYIEWTPVHNWWMFHPSTTGLLLWPSFNG